MKLPTRNGIAVPVWELSLPDSQEERTNNHHNEWTARRMGELAVTQYLRDLERHQYVMPVDTHAYLHRLYEPPELPTEEQAAREIIDAHDKGERFKRYDHRIRRYRYEEVPRELADQLIAQYGLYRVVVRVAA